MPFVIRLLLFIFLNPKTTSDDVKPGTVMFCQPILLEKPRQQFLVNAVLEKTLVRFHANTNYLNWLLK